MSNPIVTVTVLSGERFSYTGGPAEFRKLLDLRVASSGLTAATIYAVLRFRGTRVAVFDDWSTGVDHLACEGSLNTTALEAVFEGRAASALVPLELRIHNTSEDGDLIASGKVLCKNNPEEGYTAPAEIADDEYMLKSDYDADEDQVIDDDALPPSHGGSGAAIVRDRWTLTSANILNKYVALTQTPDLRMAQLSVGGTSPTYGDEFTVTADPNRLSWDGLALDGVLEAGDVLTLEYTYVLGS